MKIIWLSKGQFTMVDDEDYEMLKQWTWHAKYNYGIYYAQRSVRIEPGAKSKKISIRMHRLILGITDGQILVDHIDHNGLNNQRNNLRICTQSGNMSNKRSGKNSSSKYLGVYLSRQEHKGKYYLSWVAHITKDKKSKHIGSFKSEDEAAAAYNRVALEMHGEFANLNQIR